MGLCCLNCVGAQSCWQENSLHSALGALQPLTPCTVKSQKGPDHQATHTRVPQDSWYSKWRAKAIERDSNTMIWKARRNLSHASLVVCTYVYRHNIYRCMPTERCSFCKQIWMTKTNRFPTLHSEMVHIILWSGNVLFISDIKWYMLAKKAAPGVRCMHYITRGHMWMLFVYVLWNKIRGGRQRDIPPTPCMPESRFLSSAGAQESDSSNNSLPLRLKHWQTQLILVNVYLSFVCIIHTYIYIYRHTHICIYL